MPHGFSKQWVLDFTRMQAKVSLFISSQQPSILYQLSLIRKGDDLGPVFRRLHSTLFKRESGCRAEGPRLDAAPGRAGEEKREIRPRSVPAAFLFLTLTVPGRLAFPVYTGEKGQTGCARDARGAVMRSWA